MRALVKAIFFVLLIILAAACSTTWHKYDSSSRDGSSADPQLQYGGQFRVRSQASHGVNQ